MSRSVAVWGPSGTGITGRTGHAGRTGWPTPVRYPHRGRGNRSERLPHGGSNSRAGADSGGRLPGGTGRAAADGTDRGQALSWGGEAREADRAPHGLWLLCPMRGPHHVATLDGQPVGIIADSEQVLLPCGFTAPEAAPVGRDVT